MSYVFNNAVFSASCVRDLGLVMTTTQKIGHYEMYMPHKTYTYQKSALGIYHSIL